MMETKKIIYSALAVITGMAINCYAGTDAKREDSDAIKAALLVEDAFAEVVEMAKPAVVVITNEQMPRTQFWNDEDFDPWEFFGFPPRGGNRNRRMPRQPEKPQEIGGGSGVIISNEGFIVTNYHVIENCDYLKVKTSDGTIYDNAKDPDAVKITGYDIESDLAVLQIGGGKKHDFTSLKFADSEKLRVGQWAIAIGAPFDLDYSVAIGCISQKGRTGLGMATFDNYIQTDASINPGNSGGPLLNIRGEIIGINQFIMTGGMSKGSIGIGFAISSNLVKQISSTLISDGKVTRPMLGVYMQELNQALKDEIGVDFGVLIREVIPGKPASEAGIKPGDVILKIDGKPVKTTHELLMEVTKYKPNDKIELLIKRAGNGKEVKITLKAGVRDTEVAAAKTPDNPDKNSNINIEQLGMKLVEENGKVIVKKLVSGGAAEAAGDDDEKIIPGDVIIDINRVPVSTIKDVEEALKNNPKKNLILYMSRSNAKEKDYKYYIVLKIKK